MGVCCAAAADCDYDNQGLDYERDDEDANGYCKQQFLMTMMMMAVN